MRIAGGKISGSAVQSIVSADGVYEHTTCLSPVSSNYNCCLHRIALDLGPSERHISFRPATYTVALPASLLVKISVGSIVRTGGLS